MLLQETTPLSHRGCVSPLYTLGFFDVYKLIHNMDIYTQYIHKLGFPIYILLKVFARFVMIPTNYLLLVITHDIYFVYFVYTGVGGLGIHSVSDK